MKALISNDDGVHSEGSRRSSAPRARRASRRTSWRRTASRAPPRTRSRCTVRSACRQNGRPDLGRGRDADGLREHRPVLDPEGEPARLRVLRDQRRPESRRRRHVLGDGRVRVRRDTARRSVDRVLARLRRATRPARSTGRRPRRRRRRSSTWAKDHPPAPDTLWNVNIPAGAPKGFRPTRMGRRRYGENIVEKIDPRGKPVLLDRRHVRGHEGRGDGPPRGRRGMGLRDASPHGHDGLPCARRISTVSRTRSTRLARAKIKGVKPDDPEVQRAVRAGAGARRALVERLNAAGLVTIRASSRRSPRFRATSSCRPRSRARPTAITPSRSATARRSRRRRTWHAPRSWPRSPRSARVLEIGTGSGYQAAVLARLARWVFSLERIAELAKGRAPPQGARNRERLREGLRRLVRLERACPVRRDRRGGGRARGAGAPRRAARADRTPRRPGRGAGRQRLLVVRKLPNGRTARRTPATSPTCRSSGGSASPPKERA